MPTTIVIIALIFGVSMFCYVNWGLNPKCPKIGILTTVCAGVCLPILTFWILGSAADQAGWADATHVQLLGMSLPTAAIPYVVLKFYWDHANKREELELKRRELDLQERSRES